MKMPSLLLALAGLAAFAPMQGRAADFSPTVGATYVAVFAQTNPELPTGPIKVVDAAEGWVKVEYTTTKKARNASNPGEIQDVATTHSAWINLDQVVALIEAPTAK